MTIFRPSISGRPDCILVGKIALNFRGIVFESPVVPPKNMACQFSGFDKINVDKEVVDENTLLYLEVD